jgi:hypothetical protein
MFLAIEAVFFNAFGEYFKRVSYFIAAVSRLFVVSQSL